ncbi:unnamed protein product [Gordionus sp. m RMFG-2023]
MEKHAKSRTNKARSRYHQLTKLWSSNQISTNQKIRLFKSLILPILTYGLETWQNTKSNINTSQTFIDKCLIRITKTYYPYKTSNTTLWNRCDILPIKRLILLRRLELLGHCLRHSQENMIFSSMKWTPDYGRQRTPIGSKMSEEHGLDQSFFHRFLGTQQKQKTFKRTSTIHI